MELANALELLKQEPWRQNSYGKMQKAHQLVAQAIKRGELTRPDCCDECNMSIFPIDAHHDDYNKPLEVRWLCITCHSKVPKVRRKFVSTRFY